MRSIATLDLQYAHRFYGFKGEAQYLHGHTGVLTIEVEEPINEGVNMAYPCNEIQKVAWDVLKNFDHALILRQDDPLLPAILGVYEQTGIKNGTPQNTMKGAAFKTELAEAFPDCRLVVTKETMTVEGMIKIVYDLLKDKLNIVKLTFTSGVNAATEEFPSHISIERCPLCGIALCGCFAATCSTHLTLKKHHIVTRTIWCFFTDSLDEVTIQGCRKTTNGALLTIKKSTISSR